MRVERLALMRHQRTHHWAYGLITAYLLGFGPIALADKNDDLQQLRSKIEKLQATLAESEESKNEVADQLKASEKSISEVNRGLFDLAREKSLANASLADINKKTGQAKADTVQQQSLLERIVREQYAHGNTDAWRLMLDGRDASTVERQMHYFGYISAARAKIIKQIRMSIDRLRELEATALQKREEVSAIEIEQRRARQKLEAEKVSRQKVLTRISSDIKKNRGEIGRLKRDEDRLTKLVDALTKVVAKKPSERITKPGQKIDEVADAGFVGRAFTTLKGKLKLPVRGELVSRFGHPKEDGGTTWKGLFIRAESGQAVHAVADGLVVYADWLRGFGNLLILDHGDGYMSLYGSNESLLKQVGDKTSSGETLASVGATGGSTDSGLYFELRHEGKPFDPQKWLGK